MRFDEPTSKALTTYIQQLLATTKTRAEHSLLATYIVAIVNNDESIEELKRKCESELEEFLYDETSGFVRRVFDVLVKSEDADFLEFLKLNTKESEPEPVPERRRSPPRHHQPDKDSRKRQRSPTRNVSRSPKRRAGSSEAMEVMDVSEARDDRRASGRSKEKCKDYFQNGWCERGDACPYDHGRKGFNEFEQPHQTFSDPTGGYNPREPHWGSQGGRSDRDDMRNRRNGRDSHKDRDRERERDRDRGDRDHRDRKDRDDRHGFSGFGSYKPYMMGALPMMGAAGGMPLGVPYMSATGFPMMGGSMSGREEVAVDLLQRQAMKDQQQDSDGDRRGRRDRGNIKRRDDERPSLREEFNNKINCTPNNTTLVVVGIPHNLNTISKLDEHFSKFGPVVNIEVLQKDKRAHVKFSSHNDAYKAFKSVDAICGNRFIKVYWFDQKTAEGAAPLAAPEPPKPSREEVKKVIGENKKKAILAAQEAKQMKQELVQKKMAHVKEKNALLQKLIDQSKKPDLSKERKATLLAQIQTLSDMIKRDLESLKETTPTLIASTPKPQEVSEESDHKSAIAGKLEAMKKEALELGIELDEATGEYEHSGGGRGRGTSRGRGARGRGARGRGGRGRGGFQAGQGRITLDNRASAFLLTNLPDGILDESTLRSHFSEFGQVVNVRIEGRNAIVKMGQRKEAEFAVQKGIVINEHRAIVKWYNEPVETEEVDDAGEDFQEAGDAEDEGPVVEEEWYQGNKDSPGKDEDEDAWRRQ